MGDVERGRCSKQGVSPLESQEGQVLQLPVSVLIAVAFSCLVHPLRKLSFLFPSCPPAPTDAVVLSDSCATETRDTEYLIGSVGFVESFVFFLLSDL